MVVSGVSSFQSLDQSLNQSLFQSLFQSLDQFLASFLDHVHQVAEEAVDAEHASVDQEESTDSDLDTMEVYTGSSAEAKVVLVDHSRSVVDGEGDDHVVGEASCLDCACLDCACLDCACPGCACAEALASVTVVQAGEEELDGHVHQTVHPSVVCHEEVTCHEEETGHEEVTGHEVVHSVMV